MNIDKKSLALLIREVNPKYYDWLRYWAKKREGKDYGEFYTLLRVVIATMKVLDHLPFQSLHATASKRVRIQGKLVKISPECIWAGVQELTGVTINYKSFQNRRSLVINAERSISKLQGLDRCLTSEEEAQLEILT